LIYVDPEAGPLSGRGRDWVMRWTLLVNMLGGDAELAGRVWNPMDLQVTVLGSKPQRDPDGPLAFAIPYATTMILYIVLLMGSSLLLSSMHPPADADRQDPWVGNRRAYPGSSLGRHRLSAASYWRADVELTSRFRAASLDPGLGSGLLLAWLRGVRQSVGGPGSPRRLSWLSGR